MSRAGAMTASPASNARGASDPLRGTPVRQSLDVGHGIAFVALVEDAARVGEQLSDGDGRPGRTTPGSRSPTTSSRASSPRSTAPSTRAATIGLVTLAILNRVSWSSSVPAVSATPDDRNVLLPSTSNVAIAPTLHAPRGRHRAGPAVRSSASPMPWATAMPQPGWTRSVHLLPARPWPASPDPCRRRPPSAGRRTAPRSGGDASST